MRKRILISVILLVMVITLVFTGCGAPEAAYPAQQIKWIIHYAPGGGFDIYARAIAPYLEKYVGQDVVVYNVTGGGGAVGTSEAWRSDPDGYTIVSLNLDDLLVLQLVQDLPFVMQEFEMICRFGIATDTIGVAATSPFYTVEDLKNAGRPIKILTDEVETTHVMPYSVMDIEHSYVLGFVGGSQEYMVALIRGDGDVVHLNSMDMRPWVESGEVRPLMRFSDDPDVSWDAIGLNVPTARESGYPLLSALSSPRVIAAPPGTPADVVAVLEEALLKAMADPELQAWSEEVGRPFIPGTGEEAAAHVDGLLDLYADWVDILAAEVGQT